VTQSLTHAIVRVRLGRPVRLALKAKSVLLAHVGRPVLLVQPAPKANKAPLDPPVLLGLLAHEVNEASGVSKVRKVHKVLPVRKVRQAINAQRTRGDGQERLTVALTFYSSQTLNKIQIQLDSELIGNSGKS
jgi:hypothetical protein